jgi:D-xylose transport system substrate-binding protein
LKKLTRRPLPVALAVCALAVVVAAGCGGSNKSSSSTTTSASGGGGGGKIQACALLPDTKSSTRYTLFDAPYLKEAFSKANVSAQVLNALGDSQKQKSQAQQCLAKGAKVILLDQINQSSGNAITNLAVQQGAKVIDYDRLVPGSKAAYYISHDSVQVGQLQAKGLIQGLKDAGTYNQKPVVSELNGGITDNNAKLFKQGYDSVLDPLYANGTLVKAKAGDQWTDWDPIKGRQIFDQILARNANKVNGSIAANDGLAGAVIASLKAHGLRPIPLTGQDATPTGVQFILAGDQSGTVYKSVREEADTAAKAAIAIVQGKPVTGVNTTVSGTKSILLKPIWITKKNYKLLFDDGALKKSQVCSGTYAQYCS